MCIPVSFETGRYSSQVKDVHSPVRRAAYLNLKLSLKKTFFRLIKLNELKYCYESQQPTI